MPYAFGYMMAAKVGTGIVAELGSMRISDEIDALEVMGIDSMTLPVRDAPAGRLDGAAVHVHRGRSAPASSPATWRWSQQIGEVSSGGYFLIFWMFQNPPDLLYSVIKGMVMATVIVLVGCYYGYNASGGPVGRGHGDREVDGAQHRARAPHRDARHAGVLGREPTSPDRRMNSWMTNVRTDDEHAEDPLRAGATCAATR